MFSSWFQQGDRRWAGATQSGFRLAAGGLPHFAAVVVVLALSAREAPAADEPVAKGAPAKDAVKGTDVVGRLARVGEGYTNLRDEFARLETRITEARMKATQSEVTVVNGTRAAATLNDQILQLQSINNQPNNNDRREPRGMANRNQQNQIIALQNQLLQVTAQVRQERLRLNELTADVNRSLQQQLAISQKGFKQQEEYWKLADPFGRLAAADLRLALAELDRQLQLDPDNPGALLVRGVVHRRLGQVDEAAADLTRIAQQEGPLQAVAYAARGELYYAQGKEKEGKADLGKATSVTKKKSDPRVLLYRAWILCGQARYDLAEIELNKALRLSGVDVDAHRLLALIAAYYDGGGKSPVSIDEAQKHAERARELTKGGDWLVLEALAAVQFLAEDKKSAVETAQKAAELATDDVRRRCDERLSFYEADQRPLASWPDPFRLALPKP